VGEEKSFKGRKKLHGNEEESRQEKETLSGRTLVWKFLKASQEKHLLRGFSIGLQKRWRKRRSVKTPLRRPICTGVVLFGVVAGRGSC